MNNEQNLSPEMSEVQPPKNNKIIWWLLGIIIIALMAFAGYWLGRNKSEETATSTSTSAISGITTTANITSLTTTTTAVVTTTTTVVDNNISEASKVVTNFENAYLAFSKSPENDSLRKKVMYDFFITPTNKDDLDYQKTLAGDNTGGPVLLSSASAGDALQSYKIISKPTSSSNLLFEVEEITFNGAQGNTRKIKRTNIIELVKVNGNFLIKYYYPKDDRKEMFDGFTNVGTFIK